MDQEISFSIVIPTCGRVTSGKLERCLTSVRGQTYPHWEALIVDDASDPPAEELVKSFNEPRFKYFRHEKHCNRMIARNTGMEAAQNGWITWLDDDDGYDLEYLNTFRYHIEQEPEVKLWVCGVVVHKMIQDETKSQQDDRHICPAYTRFRNTWMPPMNKDPDLPWVHAHFDSGTVGTGMFVFARECLEKTGLFPPWIHHLHIADGVDDFLGYETGYSGDFRWVGNPYGDDYVFFRKLTMFYKVHMIEACLYTQYTR